MRKPIGVVRALVEFPVYEGDKVDRKCGWNDFVYEEPGISNGKLGLCRRECKTISSEVVMGKAGDE